MSQLLKCLYWYGSADGGVEQIVADIYGPQRMDPNELEVPSTFHLGSDFSHIVVKPNRFH